MGEKLVALVTGDGAAPEMMEQACQVAIAAARLDNLNIQFVPTPMGWNALESCGDTFPQKSIDLATELGAIFFGGVGDPAFDNTIGRQNPQLLPETKTILGLRNGWGLLVNYRPVVYYPELAHLCRVKINSIPAEGIQQIFLRFLLQDSYMGTADLRGCLNGNAENCGLKQKLEVTGEESMVSELAYYSRAALLAYFRESFRLARKLKLPVISIDKANIMARYRFWRLLITELHQQEFGDIELRHQLVDSANALLFSDPAALNGVVVCGNEHGDILSDGAIAASGSMGMMCSSAVIPETGQAMFESGAGTAPLLAGKDIANPLGRILTAAMMLRHLEANNGAAAIETAVKQVLVDGYRTWDLATDQDPSHMILGTRAMGEKVLSNLAST